MKIDTYYLRMIPQNKKTLESLFMKSKLIAVIRECTLRLDLDVCGYMLNNLEIHIVVSGRRVDISKFVTSMNSMMTRYICSQGRYVKSFLEGSFKYLKLVDKKDIIDIVGYIHSHVESLNDDYHMLSNPNSFYEYNNKSTYSMISATVVDDYLGDLIIDRKYREDKGYNEDDGDIIKKLKQKHVSRVREGDDSIVDFLTDKNECYAYISRESVE